MEHLDADLLVIGFGKAAAQAVTPRPAFVSSPA